MVSPELLLKDVGCNQKMGIKYGVPGIIAANNQQEKVKC